MPKEPDLLSKHEAVFDFGVLSDEELLTHTTVFLGEEIVTLSQEAIDVKLATLLTELANRNVDGFGLFSFALPDRGVKRKGSARGVNPAQEELAF